MRTIGASYTASNQINIALLFPSFVFLGIPFALLLGYIYDAIAQFNPFSILNLPILALALVLLTALIYVVQNKSQSRSLVMNIVIATVICVSAYYAQWSHFIAALNQQSYWHTFTSPVTTAQAAFDWALNGKMALLKFKKDGVAISGLLLTVCYLLELFFFLLPIALTHLPNLFCEKCQRYHYSFKFYLDRTQKGANQFTQVSQGHFGFINTLKIDNTVQPILDAVPQQTQATTMLALTYYQCMQCQENAYLTLHQVAYSRRPKSGLWRVKKMDKQFDCIAIDEVTQRHLTYLLNQHQPRASGRVDSSSNET